MPKINNQDFLTLPQQVGKNKRDITSLDANVQNIATTLGKVVMGELVIKLLNPTESIAISNYGVTTLSYPVQVSLAEFIKENHSLVDVKAPLMARISVAGGIIPDVTSATEYNTLFNTTSYYYVGGNIWIFRAVGYSQNVRFELYMTYTLVGGTFTFTNLPYIAMVSLISNNTYYTASANIVGGVVTLSNLVPSVNVVPCKIGDLIIAGSGIWAIDTISGSVANLVLQSGFVAPTSALGTRSYEQANIIPTEVQKITLNRILGTKIFDVADIVGQSLEEQVTSLGLTLKITTHIKYAHTGPWDNPTWQGPNSGGFVLSFHNETASPITYVKPGVDLADSNPVLSAFCYYGIFENDEPATNRLGGVGATFVFTRYLHWAFATITNKVIDPGKKLSYVINW